MPNSYWEYVYIRNLGQSIPRKEYWKAMPQAETY